MRELANNCNHQGEVARRFRAVSGSSKPICDGCFSAAAAARRAPPPAREVPQRIHVSGTGQVPRTPTLDVYDRR